MPKVCQVLVRVAGELAQYRIIKCSAGSFSAALSDRGDVFIWGLDKINVP